MGTRMKIQEFMTLHCQDILTQRSLLQNSPYAWYKFDDFEDGMPVVYAKNGTPLSVEDIITMSFEDFKEVYKDDSATEAYETYLKAFRIVEGMDLFLELRNDLNKSKETAEEEAALARKALGLPPLKRDV